MKNLNCIALALLTMALVSCGDRKSETTNADNHIDTLSTAVATGHTDIDTTAVERDAVTTIVKGTVTNVQNGKDGYTATIKDDAGETFHATVSIPNLKDPKQYRAVAVGDVITVKGESWKMDEKMYIKAEVLE
ncbi:MAG: hypothetical protein ACO1N9_04560 [Flavobacterium sp.]